MPLHDWMTDPEQIQASLEKRDLHTIVALLVANDEKATYRIIIYGANKHTLFWLHDRIEEAFGKQHMDITSKKTATGLGIFTVTETKPEKEAQA